MRIAGPLPMLSVLWGTCLASASAFAGQVALPPLTSDASVNPKQRALVFDTLSAELDFYPSFDGVRRLPQRPSALTSSCLKKASCLASVAQAHEADALVVGSMKRRGGLFWLDLAYFDERTGVRRQTFSVPTDPSGLANALGPVVRELITGLRPEEANPTPEVDLDDLDEFDDLPDGDEFETPPPDDRDTAALEQIQFGRPDVRTAPLSEPDRRTEDLNDLEVLVAPPTGEADPQAAPPSSEDRALERQRRRAAKAEAKARARVDELEGRDPTPPPAVRRDPPRDEPYAPPTLQVTGRFGGAKYYQFNFLTVGAEAELRLGGGVHLIAGIEAYNVNRELPPQLQSEPGQDRFWDAIYPINLGLLYHFGTSRVRPYVGIEVIFAQYFRDEIGADWAGGPRVRGGVDWMIVDNFGLNANLAVGGWVGQNWPFVEEGLEPRGWLPQISVGPVLAL